MFRNTQEIGPFELRVAVRVLQRTGATGCVYVCILYIYMHNTYMMIHKIERAREKDREREVYSKELRGCVGW